MPPEYQDLIKLFLPLLACLPDEILSRPRELSALRHAVGEALRARLDKLESGATGQLSPVIAVGEVMRLRGFLSLLPLLERDALILLLGKVEVDGRPGDYLERITPPTLS